MLQKLRADYLQTVRLEERARCQGEEKSTACEQQRLFWSSKCVVLPHRLCWSAKNYPSLFSLLSLSLTCSPVASSLKLAHCCIDARSKTFTWRMRFTFLLKSLFSSSSHQLSTTEEFQRSWNWGERERERWGGEREKGGTGCYKTSVSIT